MNVLITGGSGLLGTELNVENGVKPTRSELDLLDYCSLKRYIQYNKIDKIIHCAAKVGGVDENKRKNYDFFLDNLQINMNILNACKEFSLHNSIFILSTCIFPEHNSPYTESSLHEGEPHPTNYGYAYAKRMLEVGSKALLEQYGIKTTCLIPCNLYGKNDNYNLSSGHVIPSLIHKCYKAKQNNTEFKVWGNGKPQREFMYVEDLARIIENIDKQNISFSNMIVSPSIEYTIKDIVYMIAKYMNFDGPIIFDENMPNGIMRKPSLNDKFKNNFPNFKFTQLSDGLNKTIDYFIEKYPNIRL